MSGQFQKLDIQRFDRFTLLFRIISSFLDTVGKRNASVYYSFGALAFYFPDLLFGRDQVLILQSFDAGVLLGRRKFRVILSDNHPQVLLDIGLLCRVEVMQRDFPAVVVTRQKLLALRERSVLGGNRPVQILDRRVAD